ncbi:MAG: hypothetical protein K2Y23_01475 [Cyanobacteria bacterium]|nr:hypothetical protein [Cyanobacteriota bacterium]
MDIILLGITVVSLIVALVMSVTAWRLMRGEKQRSAARVAALSMAASEPSIVNRAAGFTNTPAHSAALEQFPDEPVVKPVTRAPWASPIDSPTSARAEVASLRTVTPVASVRVPSEFSAELPLNQGDRQTGGQADRPTGRQADRPTGLTHSSGFLGATDIPRDSGSRQKSLAFAAVILFVVLSGGLVWMMSGPEGTSAAAIGPNSPLELVSLTSARKNEKLAVSGLVRNPLNGKPVERLSVVVFLFDRMGTFVTSSRANVDFLKLGAGDESPFVVSLDAPATVARYRVSFRTDDGIVPHVDKRDAPPAGIQQSAVKSEVVSQQ